MCDWREISNIKYYLAALFGKLGKHFCNVAAKRLGILELLRLVHNNGFPTVPRTRLLGHLKILSSLATLGLAGEEPKHLPAVGQLSVFVLFKSVNNRREEAPDELVVASGNQKCQRFDPGLVRVHVVTHLLPFPVSFIGLMLNLIDSLLALEDLLDLQPPLSFFLEASDLVGVFTMMTEYAYLQTCMQ